jgi:hypothetical protein
MCIVDAHHRPEPSGSRSRPPGGLATALGSAAHGPNSTIVIYLHSRGETSLVSDALLEVGARPYVVEDGAGLIAATMAENPIAAVLDDLDALDTVLSYSAVTPAIIFINNDGEPVERADLVMPRPLTRASIVG